MPMTKETGRRAFSIIELVVVIGVIMVLLGIFLPTLSGTRQVAQKTKLASQVRQMASMIAMYCDSQDDIYPVADDRFWFRPVTSPFEEPPYEFGRWWGYAMVDAGFFSEEQMFDEDFLDGMNQSLSVAMCYDWRKMQPESIEPYSDRYTTAVKQSSIRYPSGKGMLSVFIVQQNPEPIYWCCTPLDPAGPVGFADGSVDIVAWHQFQAPSHAPILGIGNVVTSTWLGAMGKDR